MTKNKVLGKRFWLYSPGERARYWEELYRDGIMAIGPDEVGFRDIGRMLRQY